MVALKQQQAPVLKRCRQSKHKTPSSPRLQRMTGFASANVDFVSRKAEMLQQRTELEVLLRQSLDDVKAEVLRSLPQFLGI